MKEHPTHKGYFVAEDGRVFSNKRGTLREMIPYIDHKGYSKIRISLSIKGKTRQTSVHRLVAETYLSNPNNLPQVNHKDRDKSNNHVDNLEWCTNQYNSEHALAKTYTFQHKLTGEIVTAFNIRKWCRENNLNASKIIGTVKGRHKHHRNWVFIA